MDGLNIQPGDEESVTSCGCGAEIRYLPTIIDGKECFKPTVCERCAVRHQAEVDQRRQDASQRALESRWQEICPDLYQDTDPDQLPPHFRDVVDGWKLGPIAPAFIGPAGQKKTRAAFLILRRMHFSGVNVSAITSTRFAKIAADQFEDDPHKRAVAREELESIHRARLLLLDDLGKQRMSERSELELYDLLEYRTSHMLPSIWTANSSGAELLKMFSADRGEPILRRLAEFSEVARKKGRSA